MKIEKPMASVQSYRDLKIWQRSMQLVTLVYAITKELPKEEIYCLVQQIRRCSISVPCNIAEGSSKRSTREFCRFLNIAYGSLMELETQLQIAVNLEYVSLLSVNNCLKECQEIGKTINALINSLEQKMNSELRTLDSSNA